MLLMAGSQNQMASQGKADKRDKQENPMGNLFGVADGQDVTPRISQRDPQSILVGRKPTLKPATGGNNGNHLFLRKFKKLLWDPIVAGTKLPDFLIIGAQRAGTTSLASYLAEHPHVIIPKCKEVHFFDDGFVRGVDWYKSHFAVGRRRLLRSLLRRTQLLAYEASPYYLFHPWAASRSSRLLPEAQIIIMLRDPVDRAYSHYNHIVRLGYERLTFEEAIDAEGVRLAGELERLQAEPSYVSLNHCHFSYLARGIYLPQIRLWLEFCRPENVLILSSEEFFRNPAPQYHEVLKFLNLPKWELARYKPLNAGEYEPMSPKTREQLTGYYASHNQSLRQYLNSVWPGVGDAVVNRWPAPQNEWQATTNS